MEWEDLEPIVKTVPRAQALVRVNKDGKPRIWLFFSETMVKECGSPTNCDVNFGVQDGVAKLRLTFKRDGKFKLKAMTKGGIRIHDIPAKAPCPDGARETEACDVESKSIDAAIIVLPLAAWQAQLSVPRIPVTMAAPKAPGPATAQIDAVTYLKQKGVKVSRLAGDWYMLNGERTPKVEVLKMVNNHRRSASLPSITLENLD